MAVEDEILIDRYLRSELTEDDQLQFNNRMLDSDFALLLKEVEAIKNAAIISGQRSLKSTLQELEKQRPAKFSFKLTVLKKVIILGILLILLLSSILFIRNYKSLPVQEELYATYFEKYPNVLDPITKSSENSEELTISQNYELNKFDEAIAKGQQLTMPENIASQNLSEEETGSLFYLALSYMQKDNHKNAQLILSNLLFHDEVYKNATLYYYALSLIATRNNSKAIEVLSLLSPNEEANGSYVREGLEIIKVLKNIQLQN